MMRTALTRRLGPALLAIGMALSSLGPAQAKTPLAVVELFTSQGCSSCPPANDNLAILARRPDILALSFGVTYWDDLGWKDTFATPAYTQRQRAYGRALRHQKVWTPQMVVNGRTDVLGREGPEIEQAWRRAPLESSGPSLALSANQVAVGKGLAPKAGAEVWLVRYDPTTIQGPVKRGENTGKTLPHRNVVRELVRLGAWTGTARTYALPPATAANLRAAVLVQQVAAGPILAAVKS